MREGQNRLAEQERAAAAELLEKQRERRDSVAAAAAVASAMNPRESSPMGNPVHHRPPGPAAISAAGSGPLPERPLGLNLSSKPALPVEQQSQRHGSESPISTGNSPIPPIDDDDDDVLTDEDIDPKRSSDGKKEEDNHEDKANNNNNAAGGNNPAALTAGLAGLEGLAAAAAAANGGGEVNSVYGLIGNIQALLKVAVENAKAEERQNLLKTDGSEMEELKRSFLKRLKKEKRYRRRVQEQLEQETKRREQMEEALRVTSAETLKRITESLAAAAKTASADLPPASKDVDVTAAAEAKSDLGSDNAASEAAAAAAKRRKSGDDRSTSSAGNRSSPLAPSSPKDSSSSVKESDGGGGGGVSEGGGNGNSSPNARGMHLHIFKANSTHCQTL